MTRAAFTVFASLTLTLAGCDPTPAEALRLFEVVPAQGPTTARTRVSIRGENLRPRVTTNFSSKAGSQVDPSFQASLGTLALEEVRLEADGALTATVPVGLPVGAHPLTVTDAAGRSASLPEAFRGVAPTEERVFRFFPIPTRTAEIAFPLGLIALDAQGRTDAAFEGTVTLTAQTGTVTPGVLGPFVKGVLMGAQVTLSEVAAAQVLRVEDAQGYRGTSAAFEVVEAEPIALRFVGAASSLTAGGCTSLQQLQLVSAQGALAPAPAALTIALEAGPADAVSFFSDAACATEITSLPVPKGGRQAGFHLRATRAGPLTIIARASNFPSAQRTATVAPAAASALRFVTPSQTAAAASCSGAVGFEAIDSWGNPSAVSAPAALTFSSAPAGAGFFSDAACVVSAAGTSLSGSKASVYFRSSLTGTFELTVSAVGFPAITQRQTVTP